MSSISMINAAAFAVALTVLAIAVVLVPDPRWTTITILTALGFAASVGFVFFMPSVFRRKSGQGGDAIQIAAIGPLAVSSTLLLIIMATGFVSALLDFQKLGLALFLFGIGTFGVTSLILRAAMNVVGDVSAKCSQTSYHARWQNQVSMLAAQATHQDSLAQLSGLSEKLRYSASDVPGGTPQDEVIDALFSAMSAQLRSDTSSDLTSEFEKLDALLKQRDVSLRMARTIA